MIFLPKFPIFSFSHHINPKIYSFNTLFIRIDGYDISDWLELLEKSHHLINVSKIYIQLNFD